MRLDAYIRVSRVGKREGDSFISPDVQREQIERWAKLRGVEIAECHEDLDQTGGKLSRPGLDRMLQRIRNRETGGVVVARLDRLSRAGVGDALKLVEELHDHGAKLAAVDLGIDPTTMVGEFTMTVMLALARMERRRISEGWDTAKQRAIGRGVHIAHRTPLFGYDRGDGGRLVPNADAGAVREVFRRRGAGASWLDLARYLDEACPRENGGRWTRQTVKTMLLSPTYLGEAHHGGHRNPDAHEAIVGRDEFEAAQRVKGSRTPRGAYLLSGIARCASCGHTLRGSSFRQGRTRLYKCAKRFSTGDCPAPVTIMADNLDRHVVAAFFERLDAFEVRRADSQDVARARAQLDDAQAELEAFQRVTLAAGDPGLFAAGLRQRVEQLERAEDALRRALSSSRPVALPGLRGSWDGLALDERRLILGAAVEGVFVRRTGRVPIARRVRVVFEGDDEQRHAGKAAA